MKLDEKEKDLILNCVRNYLNKINKAYRAAWKVIGLGSERCVLRGRAHSVSGIAEDLFGLLISNVLLELSQCLRLYP